MSKNRGVVYIKPGVVEVRDIADPKFEDPHGLLRKLPMDQQPPTLLYQLLAPSADLAGFKPNQGVVTCPLHCTRSFHDGKPSNLFQSVGGRLRLAGVACPT